ncbi:MAG: hypothetical protein ACR2OP_01245 [Amylibacter sp.]
MADEPTFFEKIQNLLGGGDDKPTPVAGGRGRTVEKRNEPSDYLAKILDDQFSAIPPPNIPPIPELFTQFNDASGNIFRPVYNSETQKYELADNAPSQMTLNRGDITEKAIGYIPPQLRDPFMIGGQYERSIPHALVDNLLGLDDGVDSAGEAFGRQFNENELGTLLDMGIGAAEGAYNLVTSPIDTVGGYVGDVSDAFKSLASNEGTADEKLGNLLMAGSVLPAAKVAQLGGRAATIPLKNQAARFNDPYMESERLLAARGVTNVGTKDNPKYTGVERPSFLPDARTASTETIAEYRGRKKLADYLYENGATHDEVINAAGINRVTYKTPSGESITRDFMLLERPQINVEEALKMVNEAKGRLIEKGDGTFDLKPDLKGYKTMEEYIQAMAAGKISQKDLGKQKPGARFLSDILENPEDFAFLNNQTRPDFGEITVKPESIDIDGNFPERSGAYDMDDGITYKPTVATGYLLNSLFDHEMEHAIQDRGNKVLFSEGTGDNKTADTYAGKRIMEVINDIDRTTELLDDPSISPEKAKILNDYKSKLEQEFLVLDNPPFQLYSESPIEVLARGAVKDQPLTTPKYDVPFTGLFNPYIKGREVSFPDIKRGIGALIKDYKDYSKILGNKTLLKKLPHFLNRKPYGKRTVPMAYEEMMPYRRRSSDRPGEILGPPT